MSPTILLYGKYRFFFNSREEKRMHVHIQSPDGIAKFWLEPIIAFVDSYNLSTKELREIENIIKEKQNGFKNAWKKHFRQ